VWRLNNEIEKRFITEIIEDEKARGKFLKDLLIAIDGIGGIIPESESINIEYIEGTIRISIPIAGQKDRTL
jgi:hypothetical protein